MNSKAVEQALKRLGERLTADSTVELLLVGGTAGMLTGLLAPGRTTTDCDVMVYLPPSAMTDVERTAEAIADELGLSPTWLNSNVQLRRDALPDGWDARKIPVGAWGKLNVFAVSRIDLIAMKVLAGRAQDLDDLDAMRPRMDELQFVEHYLVGLPAKGTHPEQISEARELLDELRERL